MHQGLLSIKTIVCVIFDIPILAGLQGKAPQQKNTSTHAIRRMRRSPVHPMAIQKVKCFVFAGDDSFIQREITRASNPTFD